jgi:hypothetical protein
MKLVAGLAARRRRGRFDPGVIEPAYQLHLGHSKRPRLRHGPPGTFHQDLGADHFRKTTPEAIAARLAAQINSLGFSCVITPAAVEPVSV